MADVGPGSDGDDRRTTRRGRSDDGGRDRGQILLVTGLAVAVTLVALVLLLNTVIYTQNLATRGTAVEDGDAVAFRQEATAGVGEVIDAENRDGYADPDALETEVEEAVARYDDLHSRYSAGRGTVADVEEGSLALSEGTILHQTNASRNFTSADGGDDWLLVENSSGVRNFRATVSGENLSDGPGGAFEIQLEGESDTRTFYVYNDSADDDIAVSDDADGSAPDACTTSAPTATVDLTAGTVAGTDCPELDYPTSGEYNVTFRNADETTGTYELTVDLPPDDEKVKTDAFADPEDAASPRWGRAVYDAEFEIHYETPNFAFHTTVRVAPGEPE